MTTSITKAALFYFSMLLLTTAFTYKTESLVHPLPPLPGTDPVYDAVVANDARWEDAYNNCKLDVINELINEDLEFYHDKGGLSTSKQQLIEALKNNICGKVKRVLKKGSIEVSAIPGYGAVEIGMHGFANTNEPASEIRYARFVHVWKLEHGTWSITRVISLHQ